MLAKSIFLMTLHLSVGQLFATEEDSIGRRISETTSIYAYPKDPEEEPMKLFEKLTHPDNVTIPKTIIFKIMDIDGDGEVHIKEPLRDSMFRAFSADRYFNYSAMINVTKELRLTETDVPKIFDNIRLMLTACFSSISIDAEPVFLGNKDGVRFNTVPFHAALIERVNQELRLPVSMYMSPAKLGNRTNGMFYHDRDSFNRLAVALVHNPENHFLLPAYSYRDDPVREDDILESVRILDERAIPYKLIVDSIDPERLSDRLEFIRANRMRGIGMAIYSLETLEREFPLSQTMRLVLDHERHI